MAWIEVPPEADLVRIATMAGAPESERRRYEDGRLYVEGVEQEALSAALRAVGTAPLVAPAEPSLEDLRAQLSALQAKIEARLSGEG
jgi:hypothetical protein